MRFCPASVSQGGESPAFPANGAHETRGTAPWHARRVGRQSAECRWVDRFREGDARQSGVVDQAGWDAAWALAAGMPIAGPGEEERGSGSTTAPERAAGRGEWS